MLNRTLGFISRKLRIDAHYLYQGFVWLGISTVLIFGINLLKSIIFANFLRPETYGTYRYILTILEISSALSLSGVGLVISRSVAQGFEGTYLRGVSEYLKHSWLSILVTTSIAFYYFYRGDEVLAVTIGIGGLLSSLFNTVKLYTSLIEGKKRSDLNSIFQVISTLVPASVATLCVLFTDNLGVIVLSYFLSLVVVHSVLAAIAYFTLRPNKKVDPKAKKFTFHLSIIGTISLVVDNIDKLILFQFLGPAQLAAYSFAAAIPEQFNVLGKTLRILIYPKISEQSMESIKKHILWRAFLICMCCLAMFIAYLIACPYIFQFFFPQYIHAVPYSQAFALCVFLIIAMPYRSALLAHSRTRQMYITKLLLIGSRILFLLLLFPLWGIWGVIISFLIARFIEMFSYMYFVHFTK